VKEPYLIFLGKENFSYLTEEVLLVELLDQKGNPILFELSLISSLGA